MINKGRTKKKVKKNIPGVINHAVFGKIQASSRARKMEARVKYGNKAIKSLSSTSISSLSRIL